MPDPSVSMIGLPAVITLASAWFVFCGVTWSFSLEPAPPLIHILMAEDQRESKEDET